MTASSGTESRFVPAADPDSVAVSSEGVVSSSACFSSVVYYSVSGVVGAWLSVSAGFKISSLVSPCAGSSVTSTGESPASTSVAVLAPSVAVSSAGLSASASFSASEAY